MKKFIRIFVCLIFSFSLFTQNVYAAVGDSYGVNLVVDRVSDTFGPNSFTVAPFVSSAIESNTGSIYARSFSYDWNDHLTLRWKPTDSSISAVPNGYYSVSCRLSYNFTVKWSTSFPFGILPSSLSPSFSISALPAGSSFQLISYKTVSNSNSNELSYQLIFDLRGNIYLSNTRSSTFDLNFHIDCENSVTSSSSVANGIIPSLIVSPTVTPVNFSSNITLTSVAESSDGLLQDITGAVDNVNDTIKQEHQEEVDKANETSSDITSSSGELEGTLSAWEIFTMPFQLVKDFATAIAGDGSTSFTFPSFSIMGYQIWPSYSFDLSSIKTNFPVLYNGVHVVSGILVVNGFIHYCWRKWSVLIGDDLPEGSGSGRDI